MGISLLPGDNPMVRVPTQMEAFKVPQAAAATLSPLSSDQPHPPTSKAAWSRSNLPADQHQRDRDQHSPRFVRGCFGSGLLVDTSGASSCRLLVWSLKNLNAVSVDHSPPHPSPPFQKKARVSGWPISRHGVLLFLCTLFDVPRHFCPQRWWLATRVPPSTRESLARGSPSLIFTPPPPACPVGSKLFVCDVGPMSMRRIV